MFLPNSLLDDSITSKVFLEIKKIKNKEIVENILKENLGMTINDFKKIPDMPLLLTKRCKFIVDDNDFKKMLKWISIKSQIDLLK